MGDPPRRVVSRHMRATVKPGARFAYLAHYSMNKSTPETRARFIDKVTRAMDRF
jgi:hypothetical protein